MFVKELNTSCPKMTLCLQWKIHDNLSVEVSQVNDYLDKLFSSVTLTEPLSWMKVMQNINSSIQERDNST